MAAGHGPIPNTAADANCLKGTSKNPAFCPSSQRTASQQGISNNRFFARHSRESGNPFLILQNSNLDDQLRCCEAPPAFAGMTSLGARFSMAEWLVRLGSIDSNALE
jgi:hypothetical protein